MASPSLGGADSLTIGHSCVLFPSRAQVGLYVHDTASLFSSGFHTPGYAHGPPHTWAVSGSHAVSRLSSWAGFKMFPVHFSMTHSGCVADPNVATILFVSLAEQLDCSSLLFRFSRWMSDFAILHSQNSCINTARPEVSLKNLPRWQMWEALHLPLWKTGRWWEQPRSPLQMSPPPESPTACSLW